MPCDSSYLRHDEREAESGRVLELLKEISGQPFDHEHPSYYGRVATLDADTARLCEWCKAHQDHLSGMSLELQLWWQRHQRADLRRSVEETAAKRHAALVQSARLETHTIGKGGTLARQNWMGEMTSRQKQSAIINTQERIDTLLALYARGDDAYAQAYRANLAETIVNGVLALTADRTQEELDRVATAMHHAQERLGRVKKAETHS